MYEIGNFKGLQDRGTIGLSDDIEYFLWPSVMIQITDDLSIDENELHFEFTRASGPGGQKINKAATAVQLRFDVRGSPSLPDAVRTRLLRLAGKRVTDDGILIINARRFRTQSRNRRDAIERLIQWVRLASRKAKPRFRTGPSRVAKERRLEAKRRQGEKKRARRSVPSLDE